MGSFARLLALLEKPTRESNRESTWESTQESNRDRGNHQNQAYHYLLLVKARTPTAELFGENTQPQLYWRPFPDALCSVLVRDLVEFVGCPFMEAFWRN